MIGEVYQVEISWIDNKNDKINLDGDEQEPKEIEVTFDKKINIINRLFQIPYCSKLDIWYFLVQNLNILCVI